MRKLITAAIAASATLALAAGAVAQDPNVTLDASASPSNAGTKRKPKNTTIAFDLVVNKPGTTVQTIELKLPKQLKFAGKGLGRCNFDDLTATGPSACPSKSKAGPVGEAHAVAGPANAPVDFTVYPFVEDSDTLLFYLSSTIGVQQAIRGEITGGGRTLTITIPPELRRPGGLDASLTGLKQTLKGKVGKKYLVSSRGCKGRKWRFSGTLGFATDRIDGAPAPAPVSASSTASCKK